MSIHNDTIEDKQSKKSHLNPSCYVTEALRNWDGWGKISGFNSNYNVYLFSQNYQEMISVVVYSTESINNNQQI